MACNQEYFALFPGQGSQKVGMGKEQFSSNEIARAIFKQADEALGFSLSEICFNGPEERLTSTEIAQPAILTVSTVAYRLAKESISDFRSPVAAAGHSLGEYSALVAAEAISFSDAVLQVHKRGRYMQEAVPAGVGSMLAVLGKEVEEIESAIAKISAGVAEVANINAPGQIIIAGDKQGLSAFRDAIGQAKLIELQVSAPFHCSLMKSAADKLAADLDQLKISGPVFPIYCNYSAKPVTTPDEIRDALKRQVCGRVRWVESMQLITGDFPNAAAVEFGCGNVLSGLMKRINSNVPRHNIS